MLQRPQNPEPVRSTRQRSRHHQRRRRVTLRSLCRLSVASRQLDEPSPEFHGVAAAILEHATIRAASQHPSPEREVAGYLWVIVTRRAAVA